MKIQTHVPTSLVKSRPCGSRQAALSFWRQKHLYSDCSGKEIEKTVSPMWKSQAAYGHTMVQSNHWTVLGTAEITAYRNLKTQEINRSYPTLLQLLSKYLVWMKKHNTTHIPANIKCRREQWTCANCNEKQTDAEETLKGHGSCWRTKPLAWRIKLLSVQHLGLLRMPLPSGGAQPLSRRI